MDERKEEVWIQSEFLMNPTAAARGMADLRRRLTSTIEQNSELVYGLRSKSEISRSIRDHPDKKADPNTINPIGTIMMLHLCGTTLLRKMYFL